MPNAIQRFRCSPKRCPAARPNNTVAATTSGVTTTTVEGVPRP